MDLGKGFGFWNTIPTFFLSITTSVPDSWMFLLSSVISPVIFTWSIRSFKRLKQRRSVDLPQPEGPIKAVTLFFRIFMETDSSARFPLYQRFTLFVVIIT